MEFFFSHCLKNTGKQPICIKKERKYFLMGHVDCQNKSYFEEKNHTAKMAWFSIESSYTKGSLQINCKLEHSYYICVQQILILWYFIILNMIPKINEGNRWL